MTEAEFVETVLLRVFNSDDQIVGVDEAFGNPDGVGTQVLNIETIGGEQFQVSVTKLVRHTGGR